MTEKRMKTAAKLLVIATILTVNPVFGQVSLQSPILPLSIMGAKPIPGVPSVPTDWQAQLQVVLGELPEGSKVTLPKPLVAGNYPVMGPNGKKIGTLIVTGVDPSFQLKYSK